VLVYEKGDCWLLSTKCTLHVDRMAVLEVTDITEGFVCLFAAYWVFHIAYPKKLSNTLSFLEHAAFNLNVTIARNPVLKMICEFGSI
jgi:hypothetical protein